MERRKERNFHVFKTCVYPQSCLDESFFPLSKTTKRRVVFFKKIQQLKKGKSMNEVEKQISRDQERIKGFLKEEAYLKRKEGKNEKEWRRLQKIGLEMKKLEKDAKDLKGVI